MTKITEDAKDLLDAIRAFVQIHGYAPTVRELAEELGVGHSTVTKGLNELINFDKIRRAAGVARGIVVREE
jgi:Mn-dependent DtxR family transcriptional regulator